jgi:hypothetical protein
MFQKLRGRRFTYFGLGLFNNLRDFEAHYLGLHTTFNHLIILLRIWLCFFGLGCMINFRYGNLVYMVDILDRVFGKDKWKNAKHFC